VFKQIDQISTYSHKSPPIKMGDYVHDEDALDALSRSHRAVSFNSPDAKDLQHRILLQEIHKGKLNRSGRPVHNIYTVHNGSRSIFYIKRRSLRGMGNQPGRL